MIKVDLGKYNNSFKQVKRMNDYSFYIIKHIMSGKLRLILYLDIIDIKEPIVLYFNHELGIGWDRWNDIKDKYFVIANVTDETFITLK